MHTESVQFDDFKYTNRVVYLERRLSNVYTFISFEIGTTIVYQLSQFK